MFRKSLCWPIVGLIAWALTTGAVAQESLDKGKSAAQLFASDCSPCHKSPQGLARSGGLFGLDGFLREHYTASRESASAIASYLKAMDTASTGGRAARRSAKGDDKAKSEAKKKPARAEDAKGAKGAEKKPDALSEEPKPLGILAPEPNSGDAKMSTPAAGDAKPAESGKKSD
jgi:hypothetical protein